MNFKRIALITALATQSFLFLTSFADAQNGAVIYQQGPSRSQICYCEGIAYLLFLAVALRESPLFSTVAATSKDLAERWKDAVTSDKIQ